MREVHADSFKDHKKVEEHRMSYDLYEPEWTCETEVRIGKENVGSGLWKSSWTSWDIVEEGLTFSKLIVKLVNMTVFHLCLNLYAIARFKSDTNCNAWD